MISRICTPLAWFAFACLILFYSNELWIASNSSHPSTHYVTTSATNQEQGDKNILIAFWRLIGRFWDWTTHEPIAFYTAVLCLFTGVLAFVSFVQINYLRRADETARKSAEAANVTAKATGDSVALAGENSERQLRAYVHIHRAVRSSIHRAAPSFMLEVKNFGHTPARNGRYWFVTRIADYSSRVGFDKPSNVEIGRFELAPTAIISFPGINVPPDPQTLTDEQMMIAFQEGTIAFFVFGEFCYTDVFNKDRITRFRVRYGNDGVASGRLATCPEGNDST